MSPLCGPLLVSNTSNHALQISPGKKGRDSELLQAVQWRLLSLIEREWPAALYPAALCALADLLEVSTGRVEWVLSLVFLGLLVLGDSGGAG